MASADAVPSMHEECRRLQLSLQIASKLQQFVQTNSLAKMQRGFNVGQVNYPAVDSPVSSMKSSTTYSASTQSVTETSTAYATTTGTQASNYSNTYASDSPSMRQKPTPPKRQSISDGNNSPTQTQVPSPTATHLYRIQAQGEDKLNQATDLFNSGNFVQASQLLDKLVVKYPEDPNLYVYALFCHYNLSTMSEMAMGPTVVIHSKETTCISRAVLLISSEQYSSANQIINNAMNEFPDSAALLALSGFVSLLTEEFHKASQVADKLATKKAPFASFLKKHVHFEQLFKKGFKENTRHDPKALETYTEAFRSNPNKSKIIVSLMLACHRFHPRKTWGLNCRQILASQASNIGKPLQPLVRAVQYVTEEKYNLAVQVELPRFDVWQHYLKGYAQSFIDHMEALAIVNECITLAPDLYFLYIMQGYLYYHLNDNDRDMQAIDKALQLAPDSIMAWNNKAWDFIVKEEYQKADETLNKALAINPTASIIRITKARNYKKMGKYTEAIGFFEKIDELDNEYTVADYAVALLSTSQVDRCITMLKKHLLEFNDKSQIHTELSVAYYLKDDYNNALTHATKALQIDGTEARAMDIKASVLNARGSKQEALRIIDQVLEIENDNVVFWQTKFSILKGMDDKHQDMLECCNEIIKLHPRPIAAAFQKVLALIALEEKEDAYEAAEEFVKLDPSDGDGWALIVITAAGSERFDRSRQAINKVKSLGCHSSLRTHVDKIEQLLKQAERDNNNRSITRNNNGGTRRAIALQDYHKRDNDEVSLREDEIVTVLSQNNNWAYIRDSVGDVGNVPLRYLRIEEDQTSQMAASCGTRGVRILSLDGGGTRGVVSIQFLKQIEERIAPQKLHEYFDLVAGTSTGALLAICIVYLKFNAEQCSAFYRKFAGEVFPKTGSKISKVSSDGELGDSKKLEQLLREYLKDTKLSDVTTPKVIITGTCQVKAHNELFLFRNYESPEDIYEGSADALVLDAALASTAAPLYLRSRVIDGRNFVDGGLQANNPAYVALCQAGRIWPQNKLDLLVSLGTGVKVAADAKKKSNGISTVASDVFSRALHDVTSSTKIHKDIVALVSNPHAGYSTTTYIRLQVELLENEYVGLNEIAEEKLNFLEKKAKQLLDAKDPYVNLFKSFSWK